MPALEPLPHGYTNRTLGDGRIVVKDYTGPDIDGRRAREHNALSALSALAGVLPVPPVVRLDHTLTTGFVDGVHGQDLIAIDVPTTRAVLATCGRVLGELQRIDPALVIRDAPPGAVLVHGDFGPNNLLLDPETYDLTALLDWEWVHTGAPIEDLVWCEWIVRMHSPERVPQLPAYFQAYEETGGHVPAWPERHEAMLQRCQWLREFCTRWEDNGAGVERWEGFIDRTAGWSE